MITERSITQQRDVDFNQSHKYIKAVIDLFWRPTNQDFNIRLGLLAGVSFPPSSRAPRVSLAPNTPFPFPLKRLPRRLSTDKTIHNHA